jgi:hypothetical protein
VLLLLLLRLFFLQLWVGEAGQGLTPAALGVLVMMMRVAVGRKWRAVAAEGGAARRAVIRMMMMRRRRRRRRSVIPC